MSIYIYIHVDKYRYGIPPGTYVLASGCAAAPAQAPAPVGRDCWTNGYSFRACCRLGDEVDRVRMMTSLGSAIENHNCDHDVNWAQLMYTYLWLSTYVHMHWRTLNQSSTRLASRPTPSKRFQEEDLTEERASCWDGLHTEERCCRGLAGPLAPSRKSFDWLSMIGSIPCRSSW